MSPTFYGFVAGLCFCNVLFLISLKQWRKACLYAVVMIVQLCLTLNSAHAQEPIKVAIIDTGLNLQDQRFSSKLCPDALHTDFTNNNNITDIDGHGTHVAGLIKQYAGEGAYCFIILKYYDAKQLGKDNEDHELQAIVYAVISGANIINLSGGGPSFDEREYLILKKEKDVLLIGAAGNEGQNVRRYPGCLGLSNTRCVGALGTDGRRASFSNYGPWVNAWQPGVDILSTMPDNKTGVMSGTSMSTAIETGLEIRRRLDNALHHKECENNVGTCTK